MSNIITTNLRWKELTAQYPVTKYTVAGQSIVPFEVALEDGSIEALIKECADAMYGGDMLPVVKRLIENCQSKKCVDAQKAVKNSAQKAGEAANAMFLAYLQDLKSKLPVKPVAPGVAGKAKWRVTDDEIEAFTDAIELGKVVDSMASYKAKYLIDKPELSDEDMQFLDRYELARNKLKAMKAAHKKAADKQVPELSEKLLEKLTKGGKATLSAAEVEELRKLLS